MKYTTRDEVEVQPGCDVLRGDEGHVDHGGDEDLPLVPTTIVSQPLEGVTMTGHQSISNQYDEMGGGFPPDDEGNGAFINVDCHVMPCPTQKNHHDMMLPIDDEHVELPAIGVDVLNGAQSPLTHNDINEITPSLVDKVERFERFVQSVHEDVGMTKRQPRIILRSVECVPDQATAQNSYGLGQDLNGSERLSTEMGVPPMSSRMEEIMPMLDGVIPETLCSVGCKEIMEETSRHNNIDYENHEQHTNIVQRTHIVDGMAQFDRGAMPEVAIPSHEEYGCVPCHPTSFASRPPNTLRDMEQIREWLENLGANTREVVDWPDIDSSPLNEYNIEGIFDMEFPTLFPIGEAEWLQPRTTVVFIKRNAKECLPATIEELRSHLDTLPDAQLAERVMRFGTNLRGTHAYWNKCQSELTNLVHQIGCPTIFFILRAANMQWPDLHRLMLGTSPNDPRATQQWRYKNVIDYPHIVAAYMHQRHTLFHEEVLTKFHGAMEFWSRMIPIRFLKLNISLIQLYMHGIHRSLIKGIYRCNEGSCLCKKGRSLVCRYNSPWELRSESTFFIDENGQKKYEPKQNDDRVNVHNHEILVIWRGNVDCHPVTLTVVVLKYIAKTCEDALKSGNALIDAYIDRPSMLDDLPLIEVARSWTHNPRRKGDPWRPRERAAIVRVWPHFHTIPSEDSESFQEFYWSELLLYKPFCSFQTDIGVLKEQIIQNWHNMRYNAWHVNRNPTEVDCDIAEDEDNLKTQQATQFVDEMRHANNLSVDVSIPPNVLTLGNRQRLVFETFMQHYASGSLSKPLKLIIQGTIGTSKLYLIRTIKDALENVAYPIKSPLLLLAPTRVVSFNISSATIHSALHIPIRDMKELQAFPEKKHQPFGGRSMILIGVLDTFLGSEEIKMFRNGVHLYTTYSSIRGHNRDRLKSLNIPIAHSIAEKLKKSYALGPDDDQLELEVLVAIGLIPPSPPSYVVVDFDNYIRCVWDPVIPMSIPIVLITHGQRRQLPLHLAWALTIHKSQGLTLNQATVDIRNVERQGMVFTTISHVRDIKSLRISPPFMFEHYARMSDSAYVTIRKKEEKRLQMLSI
eukprot:Gb_22018 [translate_table: standard]